MLKIENVDTYGWEAAIRGLRNPMNSWAKSDSYECPHNCGECEHESVCIEDHLEEVRNGDIDYVLGDADRNLMLRMNKGGPEESKYRRMITVTLDVTAPLYWWKEYDTYKVGTVANSCSTMHKIQAKEFTIDDFSHEHLYDSHSEYMDSMDLLKETVKLLNLYREKYLKTKDKNDWWQMIQLLPSSYNQRRTLQLNYEVLANIYRQRRHHKLDEWHTFCDWIEKLPYAELIIGEKSEEAHSEAD